MSQQPAGWYDDPETQDTLRYWDGVQWTHHTSPRHRPSAQQTSQQGGAGQPGGAGHQGGQGSSGTLGSGGSPWTQTGQQQTGQQYGGQPGYQQQGYPTQQHHGGGGPQYGGWQQAGFSMPSTADGQPLASWVSRLGARLLDWVLVLVVTTVLTFVFAGDQLARIGDLFQDYYQWVLDNPELASDVEAVQAQTADLASELVDVTLVLVLVYGLTWLLYDAVFTAWRGATLGKMAVGIHVRSVEGAGRLNPAMAVSRSVLQFWVLFSSFVPYLALLGFLYFLIDHLFPLWDERRQALHDKVARTQVVRGRLRQSS